jgi:hypothetical protein
MAMLEGASCPASKEASKGDDTANDVPGEAVLFESDLWTMAVIFFSKFLIKLIKTQLHLIVNKKL